MAVVCFVFCCSVFCVAYLSALGVRGWGICWRSPVEALSVLREGSAFRFDKTGCFEEGFVFCEKYFARGCCVCLSCVVKAVLVCQGCSVLSRLWFFLP